MREFNLEEAKAGNPVCTKTGKKVRIVDFDLRLDKFTKGFVAIIDYGIHGDCVRKYRNNGTPYTSVGEMLCMEEKERIMYAPAMKDGSILYAFMNEDKGYIDELVEKVLTGCSTLEIKLIY